MVLDVNYWTKTLDKPEMIFINQADFARSVIQRINEIKNKLINSPDQSKVHAEFDN